MSSDEMCKHFVDWKHLSTSSDLPLHPVKPQKVEACMDLNDRQATYSKPGSRRKDLS